MATVMRRIEQEICKKCGRAGWCNVFEHFVTGTSGKLFGIDRECADLEGCAKGVGETPKPMRIVVFLQNAWSAADVGERWKRVDWLKALELSHSGQRLRVLIDDFNVCENTTPRVGATSDSKLPPDDAHIKKVIRKFRPDVVIACGKQAETALVRIWKSNPLLAVPHPSHRFLTNELYRQARALLESGHFAQRIALRQGKGQIVRENLTL